MHFTNGFLLPMQGLKITVMYTQKPNYIHFFQANLEVFALKLLLLLKLKEMINKFVICDFFLLFLTTFAHKTVIPP